MRLFLWFYLRFRPFALRFNVPPFVQLRQLQLLDLLSFAPNEFKDTPDSMVDKWGVLMDHVSDSVHHDANVEG